MFRIVSKHLTATMAGEDEDHAYEMREVPWVQYFSEGYALHAAYWHDGFGKPRSHGCVNLSPRDARFLFHFTNPGVPLGWHGRTLSDERAIVYVHP
ncbi:MAG: L,D-transpeptidase [Polyangiaceae bacterium]